MCVQAGSNVSLYVLLMLMAMVSFQRYRWLINGQPVEGENSADLAGQPFVAGDVIGCGDRVRRHRREPQSFQRDNCRQYAAIRQCCCSHAL